MILRFQRAVLRKLAAGISFLRCKACASGRQRKTGMKIPRLVLACVLLAGCSHRKTVTTPVASTPPPPAPKPAAHKRKNPPLAAGDMLIKNCTVVNEKAEKATCECRKGKTHVDANGHSFLVVECQQ